MLVIVLCLVGAVWGQSNPPPKCCVARQFEAKMGETGGSIYSSHGVEVPALIDSDNVMHYDYYNRTIVMEVNTHNPDNTTTYTRIIQDYKRGIQHVFGAGSCTTSTIRRGFREPCIPDNAKFVGSSYVGYGVHKIAFNNWEFAEPDTGNDMRLVVTSSTCVPVVEAIFGNVNNAPSELVFVFTNFQPGIKTPDLFVLPSLCTGAADTINNEDHPHHIQRAILAMDGWVS
ncbi:uncharacterized protein [Haliotis cracherodii]|uniref:uncharacterized protein LOC124139751 n=1 Tax=Haliotis rufescens TaxID=6454 RepID=UPI00201F2F5E|nr:uncharacterized protein LOC124139751 [Haliotis rufescens]